MAEPPSKAQKRQHALRAAAALPPLSLACVHVAEDIVRDIVAEIAEACERESGSAVSCSDELQALLEGAASTLPSGGKSVSAPLHALLTEEATATAQSSRTAREALAAGIAAGAGADVFGNRPKQPSAETIVCTNCGTALSTNRFAPHLERCMLGKGRASARHAREAMQNSA